MQLCNLNIKQENSILKGFENDIEKSHIVEHTRKTKSGKLSNVKAYDDKRKKKVDETNGVDKLSKIIRKKQKDRKTEETEVLTGNRIFVKNKIDVGEYKDIIFYSAKAEDNGSVNISFMKDNQNIIFSSTIKEKKEDRTSFEKYKGLIYILNPMDDEKANEIIDKLNDKETKDKEASEENIKYKITWKNALHLKQHLIQARNNRKKSFIFKNKEYIVKPLLANLKEYYSSKNENVQIRNW